MTGPPETQAKLRAERERVGVKNTGDVAKPTGKTCPKGEKTQAGKHVVKGTHKLGLSVDGIHIYPRCREAFIYILKL